MASTTIPSMQLGSVLKQRAAAPLYLVVGEEDLLRDLAVAVLKEAVLGDGGDYNYDLFYGDEAGGAEILTCASELPVFAERRLIVVKTVDKLSAREGETLLPYLAHPMERTTLVFVAQKLDGRLKFSQALTRAAVTVDCAPLREAHLPAWITQDAERIGVRLEADAIHVLKETSGGSLYGIRRELEKLAAYLPSDRPVTAVDVHLLRGMEPGASVFDLTLAIAEGQRGKALSILARNLEAGEAPLRILGSLVWQYRRLWKAKDQVQQGGREGDAARMLRMDPLKVRGFLGKFSHEHLQAALRLFLQADAQLKGGSSGRPKMVLEQLLLHLCSLVKTSTRDAARRPPAKQGAARVVSNVRTITRGSPRGG